LSRSRVRASSRSRSWAAHRSVNASRRSARTRRMRSSARSERASTRAVAALTSSPRRPVTGRTWDTMSMFSPTPATASRLNVTRGFGQRAAARMSARTTSTSARSACTRVASLPSRASTSDSVRATDCARTFAGTAKARNATHTKQVRIRPRVDGNGNGRRAGPSGQDRKAGGARGDSDAMDGGS
jgi:hypothetical protein